MYELVRQIVTTLNETGEKLVQMGYRDLGSFVLEALRSGERVGRENDQGPDVNTILEQIVKGIPGFRDMDVVNGQGELHSALVLFHRHFVDAYCVPPAVYVFKKAEPSKYSYVAEIRSCLETGSRPTSTMYIKMPK